jgi:hypothetical protein
MYRACLLFLLAVPVALHSQSFVNSSSSTSDGGSAEVAAVSIDQQQPVPSGGFFRRGMFTPSVHDAPVATFTASYTYQYAPDYVGADRSLMGWSATPEVNFAKYLGLQAEFTGLYMRSVYPGQNRLMMAAGPRINFMPHSRFAPFVFMEGGEIRATNKATDIADWNPVASAGFGVNHKLSRGISLQLIPGQYIGQLQDNGSWNHSFMTKAGITFNLYK